MGDVDTDLSPSTRPLRADATRNRERLLEAARAVFTARGGAATVEEIARTADVGVGTLYRHFPRRIDLVEAVYRTDVDALVTAAAAGQGGDPWLALVAWLDEFLRYAEAKRTFLNELHEAFEKNPELALSSREKIADAVARVLAPAQAAGVVRVDLDQHDLLQLVGGLCMARNASLAQNQRLLTYVLDGIRVPPPVG